MPKCTENFALQTHNFSHIPIQKGRKIPAGSWKKYQTEKASRETVAKWQADGLNLGVVTGPISGVAVIDLDSADAIALAQSKGLPATPAVKTPRGEHHYFAWPVAGLRNKAALFDGIDIRGEGGYVVAAGSIFEPTEAELAEGKIAGAYEWIEGTQDLPFADLPDWVFEAAEKPKPTPAPSPISHRPSSGLDNYGRAALDSEIEELQRAGEGRRNDQLNKSAFALGQLVGAGALDEKVASSALKAAALRIGLDEAEADKAIHSGMAAGKESPRQIDERPAEPAHSSLDLTALLTGGEETGYKTTIEAELGLLDPNDLNSVANVAAQLAHAAYYGDFDPDEALAALKARAAEMWGNQDEVQLRIDFGHQKIVEYICGIIAVTPKAMSPQKKVSAPKPASLWNELPLPDYPEGTLPGVLEEFCRSKSEIVGVDMAGFVISTLVTCAAAIPDRVQIKVKRHDDWMESARLWGVVVGSPSAKKSPSIEMATRPLMAVEKSYGTEYNEAMREFRELGKQAQDSSQEPTRRHIIVKSTTVEAIQEVLKSNSDGVLSLNDELGGWFGQMDQYKQSASGSADRSFWLQAFNGGHYSVNRVKRGFFDIDNLSLGVLGGIQPDALRKIAKGMTDDGLIQRAIPVTLTKAKEGKDHPQGGEAAAYTELIRSLTTATTALGEGTSLDLERPNMPLVFDDEAQEVRAALEKRHLKLVAAFERVSPQLSSHIGKYDGIFARLCVVWHAVENSHRNPLPARVSAPTARRVVKFMHEFMLPHARRFYTDVLGVSDDFEAVKETARYILTHEAELRADGLRFNTRRMMRGNNAMQKVARDSERAAEEVVGKLEMFGWLEAAPPARGSSKKCWIVNEAVWATHAERAAKAKQELEEQREIMAADFASG